MKQNITILGATGSIGVNTLDLIAKHSDKYQIFALTGFNQIEKLAEQCCQFHPRFAVVADAQKAKELTRILQNSKNRTEVLYGKQALIDVATAVEVDVVVAAIVGAAGLPPAYAAARHGKKILLANKETLVVAGALFLEAAQTYKAQILPVDSEHNAIFQVLPYSFNRNLKEAGVESIILTASGGPFLQKPLVEFTLIQPEEAVKHPNWSMGRKISIDSATMMNKGLEVIEAHWLFGADVNQIEVIVHPQSVIHSMVRYLDGSVLAQLGTPDMRTPIGNCLAYPERIQTGVKRLEFSQLSGLTFYPPDLVKFPCLKLAFDALKEGGDAPCVLNAANEVAVDAFLNHRIKFTQIAELVSDCLEQSDLQSGRNIEALLEKDNSVREQARLWVNKH